MFVHVPALSVEYMIVYGPGVEASKSITPVVEFIINPVVELNDPPLTPVTVGVTSVPSTQYGEPE
ncbi:hypothetical protein GILI108418_15350 [Gillisia limnaea]